MLEEELYEPMRAWLEQYLKYGTSDTYSNVSVSYNV